MTEITLASSDEGFAFIQQEVKEDTSLLCANVSVIQQPTGNSPAPHSTNANQDISCPLMSLHCPVQRTLSHPSQCIKLRPNPYRKYSKSFCCMLWLLWSQQQAIQIIATQGLDPNSSYPLKKKKKL